MPDRQTVTTIRRLLRATLVVGMIGTGSELLLIGHVESVQQRIPLVLLAVGVAAVTWVAVSPGRVSVRSLQAVMAFFVVAGGVGVGLHYQGNVEFELEMYPGMSGVELVRETLTGATPVLAPGTMTLLGLIGLTLAYRHPCVWETEEAGSRLGGDS